MSAMYGLATPAAHGNASSSNHPGGKTMPDITLGSIASDFDAQAAEDRAIRMQNGGGWNDSDAGHDDSSLATPSIIHRPAQRGKRILSGHLGSVPEPDSSRDESHVAVAASSSSSRQKASGSSTRQNTLSPRSKRNIERRRQIAGDEMDDSASQLLREGPANGTARPLKPQPDQLAKSTSAMPGRYLGVGADSSGISEDGPNQNHSGSLDVNKIRIGDGDDDDGAIDEDDDLMSQSHASIATSPGWNSSEDAAANKENLGDRKARSGRTGKGGDALSERKDTQQPKSTTNAGGAEKLKQMTLREQQQEFERLGQENFNLRMQKHYLERDLQFYMNASQLELATQNAKLKAALETRVKESKTNKKLLLQQDKQLKELEAERDRLERELARRGAGSRADGKILRDLEDELDRLRAEKDEADAAIDELERRIAELEESAEKEERLQLEIDDLKDKLDQAESSKNVYRRSSEEKDELVEDLREDLAKVADERDRVMEALEAQQDLKDNLEQLEEDKRSLQTEITALKTGDQARGEERRDHLEQISRLQTEVHELQSRHLTLTRSASRAGELDEILQRHESELLRLREINAELTKNAQTYETELEKVASHWSEEVRKRSELLEDAEGRLAELEDELKNAVDMLEEKAIELDAAHRELAEVTDRMQDLEDRLEAMTEERQVALNELAGADRDIEQRDAEEEDRERMLADMESEIALLREAENVATGERDRHRKTVEDLSRQLADVESERRKEREDLKAEVRRFDAEAKALKRELEDEVARYRRQIDEREKSNERLQKDIDAARDRLGQRDRDVFDLQDALRNLEHGRKSDSSDRQSLELEIARVRRDLQLAEDDLQKATDEIERMTAELQSRESEVADIIAEKRDLENRLLVERQDRLSMSDRLIAAQKATKTAEGEATLCRQKIEDLEKRSPADRRSLATSQRVTAEKREYLEFLQLVVSRLNKILGSEEEMSNGSIAVLKDKVQARLRQLAQINTEVERKIKGAEGSFEQRLSSMSRELEAKRRQIEKLESSVSQLNNTKLSWRAMLERKEEELANAKSRSRDLNSELADRRILGSTENSSEIRSLTARAQSAEKRVATLANQLATLQSQVAQQEARHADASSKWEDRVKEFEKRLKAAHEKVKAEKQGGKERALQLENIVKSLQDQLRTTQARNVKLQSILNAAQVMGGGRRDDPDAL